MACHFPVLDHSNRHDLVIPQSPPEDKKPLPTLKSIEGLLPHHSDNHQGEGIIYLKSTKT